MRSDTVGAVAPTPNVTPMIDVMLVLLCIFMIVTPSLVDGGVAVPPVAENLRPHPVEEGDHTLAIDVNGALYLDRKPIAIVRLGDALSAIYASSSADRVLYVRADRELSFGQVGSALEVARASGVAVVGLVSEQKKP